MVVLPADGAAVKTEVGITVILTAAGEPEQPTELNVYVGVTLYAALPTAVFVVFIEAAKDDEPEEVHPDEHDTKLLNVPAFQEYVLLPAGVAELLRVMLAVLPLQIIGAKDGAEFVIEGVGFTVYLKRGATAVPVHVSPLTV